MTQGALRLAVINNPEDCICPLIFMDSEDCVNFTKCCIRNTIFINSFQLCRFTSRMSETRFTFRIHNLNTAMDNSRIHFLNRLNCQLEGCDSTSSPYTEYVKSHEISVGEH